MGDCNVNWILSTWRNDISIKFRQINLLRRQFTSTNGNIPLCSLIPGFLNMSIYMLINVIFTIWKPYRYAYKCDIHNMETLKMQYSQYGNFRKLVTQILLCLVLHVGASILTKKTFRYVCRNWDLVAEDKVFWTGFCSRSCRKAVFLFENVVSGLFSSSSPL